MMINGKLPNFLERNLATFYSSSILLNSKSPQFSLTVSNISIQRSHVILLFMPTAIKSERVVNLFHSCMLSFCSGFVLSVAVLPLSDISVRRRCF